MAVDFAKSFHFCSPDGVHAITLVPGVPREVSPIMAAAFASHVAQGNVNGTINGSTIMLEGKKTEAPEVEVESQLDDETEETPEVVVEEAPEEEVVEEAVVISPMGNAEIVVPLPEIDKTDKTRQQVVKEAVSALLDLGHKEYLTETNEPRMSALRKITYPNVTVEERDAALSTAQSE